MATTKRKSRILEEMHETARGLHKAGLIDKRRIREFDALCLLDLEEMSPQRIKSLREETHYGLHFSAKHSHRTGGCS